LRWGELQGNSTAANRVFEENHRIYKRLRDSEAGRAGISALMHHHSEWVRVAAATHSLAWAPEAATATLEEIERSDGLIAVDAKWTLRTYRAGTLNLDW
jgi:hypothetical protein